MLAIKNAKLVLEHGVLNDGVLIINNGRIAEIGTSDEIKIPEGCEIYDAKGLYVGPGFVDIHVHGGGGYLFEKDPLKAAEHFLRHGETTVLATLYYDLTKEGFIEAITKVQNAMKQDGAGKAIGGFYMEGPYMNPKYGASPEKNKWKGEIREEDYSEFVELAGKDAKVWAVAPERAGLEPFLKKIKAVNPETVIAVGHSEATPGEIRALKKYGITLQTHCMNATGRHPCSGGTRSCGPDEACMMDNDMYAEMICDSQGIHVEAEMQKFIIGIKGVDKVVLISDSFVNNDPIPEEYAHITDLTFDASGGLCGSRLTLDAAARNIMKHTGCDIVTAFLMASRNPARAIGKGKELGSIEVGKIANLVVVDNNINVVDVMLQGKIQ